MKTTAEQMKMLGNNIKWYEVWWSAQAYVEEFVWSETGTRPWPW